MRRKNVGAGAGEPISATGKFRRGAVLEPTRADKVSWRGRNPGYHPGKKKPTLLGSVALSNGIRVIALIENFSIGCAWWGFLPLSSRNPPLVVFGRIAYVRPFLSKTCSDFKNLSQPAEIIRGAYALGKDGRIIQVAPDSATFLM